MTITEVSKKYGLTQDTLRCYKKIGIIPKANITSMCSCCGNIKKELKL